MFDTNKEERQGAWVVLFLYGAVAVVPPLASLWLARQLESGSGPHSGMGLPLVLGALAFTGLAASLSPLHLLCAVSLATHARPVSSPRKTFALTAFVLLFALC